MIILFTFDTVKCLDITSACDLVYDEMKRLYENKIHIPQELEYSFDVVFIRGDHYIIFDHDFENLPALLRGFVKKRLRYYCHKKCQD